MTKISPSLLVIGLLMIAAGVLMPIIAGSFIGETFRYIFTAGAALTLLARLFQAAPPASTPVRIKRLLRLESWSAIIFCVAAFFAFYNRAEMRDWLAFTLAGAVIQIYCSIALSLAVRKK
ncbi:MAG: hypothetical protein NC301_06445 [Bacteroides sp.]|nr:hypothetical protein [Bacteroides sp.]MCM1378868.1 hypothetical protein [Bacteroides sp.]MCM1445484.1 hypothetical protein [Prevotella sp.]